MKHLKQLVFNLLLLSSFAAVAEEHPEAYEESLLLLYQDEEIISIATGTAKPLHLAPSVASVITAREIKALGARTLDEALEFIPGLHVSRDQYSQSAIFSIRGIHSNFNSQVILLINGHPINEPISGSRPPQFKLPVANISRIEVIRGPGSAVYGADAFAGVINVITKRADEINGTVFGARAGSFGNQDIWVQHGGKLADWSTAFSFEHSTTDGDNNRIIESDLQSSTLDPSYGTSASLAPGPMSTQYELYNTSLSFEKDHWSLWLNSWNLRDAGIGVGITQALDPTGRQEADQYTAKLDYKDKNFSENWQLETSLTYRAGDQQSRYQMFPANAVIHLDDEGNIFVPGSTSGGYARFTNGMLGNPGGELDHGSFETAFSYYGKSNHLIRMAFGIKYDKVVAKESKNFGLGVINPNDLIGTTVDSPLEVNGTLKSVTGTGNVFLPDSSRTVRHLSLQDEWQFARDWELTSGIRYDHYSDFGSTTNPRLALVWATRYNLTSKLLYGRAFRAPGFGELYYSNNPATIGNKTLNPEILDMVELAFDYRPTYDLELVLNLFKYQADDLIGYGADGIAQNMRNQRGHGMELNFDYTATNKLTLLGNFAWQKSKDQDTAEPIADAPGYQTSLALRLRATNSCTLNSQANWVAGRKRVSGDNRPTVKDYTTVDLSVRCNHIAGKPLEIAASIRNTFNADVREPSPYNPMLSRAGVVGDYPQEGRSLYIEASYTFK